jgi:hypothetical protein
MFDIFEEPDVTVLFSLVRVLHQYVRHNLDGHAVQGVCAAQENQAARRAVCGKVFDIARRCFTDEVGVR